MICIEVVRRLESKMAQNLQVAEVRKVARSFFDRMYKGNTVDRMYLDLVSFLMQSCLMLLYISPVYLC